MLSVVMPVFNGVDTLDEQLTALWRQEYTGSWELVIADNGSDDGSQEVVAAWTTRLSNLRIVDASERRGCAAADNIGATAADGSALVFCDQDDVVQPGWLTAIAEALRTHDLVAGRNEFGTLEGGGEPVADRSHRVRRSTGRNRRGPSDFYGFLPWGLSCNLGVSRRAFEGVGGFDEELRGGDDLDLCWRIQLAGYPMHFAADAVVAKRHRSTARGIWDQHFNYGVHDVALFRKFHRHGLPRRLGRGLRRYAWLVAHAPDVTRPAKRHSWIRVAAAQTGRVVGSFRERRLYL